jgi:small subunit ribosomal protein S15
MAIDSVAKKPIIEKYAMHEADTGSPEVQIALLTERISNLTRHLQTYKQDKSCKRSLMKMVGKRKALLRYLHRKDVERYKSLIAELGIRGAF